jgi:hypothetical protein
MKKKKPCVICGKPSCCHSKHGLCDLCFREERRKHYVANWLHNGIITRGRLGKLIRDYILKDQAHMCAVCGISQVWNNKDLIFILDHIDGNSMNNKQENLRMVCPNCDSQLPTYKNRNKGNGSQYSRSSGNLRYARKKEKCPSLV